MERRTYARSADGGASPGLRADALHPGDAHAGRESVTIRDGLRPPRQAVDEFLARTPDVRLKTFAWTNVPGAYLVKP